jgi:TolB-like protein
VNKRILFLLLLSLSICSPLFAETKKMRIAIMDFSPKGIAVKDSRTISELIRNDMINTNEYTVVERDQMNKILYEQGFQMTGCTDDSCAVEAGKLLSANKILVGSVIKLGDKIIITGRIVDVEKGTADFSEKADAETMNDLDDTAERFVKRLTDRMLGKKPEPEKKMKYYNAYSYPGAGNEAWQNCGYSSLVFALGGVVSVIPVVVYQSRYAKFKREYTSWKTMLYMDIAVMGTFDPLALSDLLAMKKSLGDMKTSIRNRDIALYTLAGFGGLSFIMAIATLGSYVSSEYAFLKRMDSAPFAVYPSYYCEPASVDGAAFNHHVDLMMRYRF